MFNVGDVLKVSYPGFNHYGIYIGDNKVIHNSKKFMKVEEINIVSFSDNKEITISSIKSENPLLAVQTAKNISGYLITCLPKIVSIL